MQRKTIDMNEEETRLAYLLLVHNNPEQLNLFLNQLLYDENCDIYIHVDKKNSAMMDKLVQHERIKVYSEYEVHWASFEMMAGTIVLMKAIVESGKVYSHVYYGSGNDFLTRKGLHDYLDDHPGSLFMKIFGEIDPKSPSAARYRICWPTKLMVRDNWHPYRFIRWMYHLLFRFGIILNANKSKIEFNRIYRGTQWFIVPFEVIVYLINYIETNPDYLDYWKHALAPDEFLFQTIIMNSKYSADIQPALMYINTSQTRMKHNHPETITMDDIKRIEESGCYCARKFDANTDKNVINYFIRKVVGG